MNVLIIDDDVFQQKALGYHLSLAGHRVLIAANGQEAIEHIAKDSEIDLIVCDVMMPVLTGPSFLLMLKRYFTGRFPAIIVISGVKDGEEFLNKIEISYDHFFKKPIDYDAFNKTILEVAATAP
jgi:CheY-like chemotaxis protein